MQNIMDRRSISPGRIYRSVSVESGSSQLDLQAPAKAFQGGRPMSTSRLFRKTPIRSGSWLTRAPIRSAHVVAGMLALSILGAGLAPAQNILDGTDLAGVTFADGGVLNLEGDALLSI